MIKKSSIILILFGIASLLLTACSFNGSGSNSGNQVHMNDTSFTQSSITIKKGQSITLVADTAIAHVIANGTWKNNTTAIAEKEVNAPTVQDRGIGAFGSETIGPFPETGTFKLYCTVHPGMNLTVIVQ